MPKERNRNPAIWIMDSTARFEVKSSGFGAGARAVEVKKRSALVPFGFALTIPSYP